MSNRDGSVETGPTLQVKVEGAGPPLVLLPDGLTGWVGWSYGALVALDWSLDHVDRVRTLALIEPPSFWVLHALGAEDEETRQIEASLSTFHGDIRLKLELLDERRFGNGMVHLHYRVRT